MGYKLPGLVRRDNKFSIRIRVPDNIRHIIGKGEVWKSLETGDENLAKEEYGQIFSKIEKEFSRLFYTQFKLLCTIRVCSQYGHPGSKSGWEHREHECA